MATLKTKPEKASVAAFLKTIDDDEHRRDCETVAKMMARATGAKPTMWGTSIVGFGAYPYVSERSGREGDWFQVGFSPRKNALTIYLMGGLEKHAARLKKLGKHKTGKGCLYVGKLSDVDRGVLEEMIERAAKDLT
jgi:hypothetical protein